MHPEVLKHYEEIGRKGGLVRSERKTEACRANAKLAGAPVGSNNRWKNFEKVDWKWVRK